MDLLLCVRAKTSTHLGVNIYHEFKFLCQILSVKSKILFSDEPGITFVAFHGKINNEFDGNEMGDFHSESLQPENGEWVLRNDRHIFRSGDVLYYWIYVQHKRLGYRLDNAKFVYPGILFSII